MHYPKWIARAASAVALLLLAMGLVNATEPMLAAASPPAASGPVATLPPAKVMLLGSFHFDNPGLDAVKHDTINVMTPASQQYLQTLAERLAQFKPTKVLLEYDLANDDKINARYRDYLAGRYALERNEIYQIGFRVAKLAGHARVYSFDERTVQWDSTFWSYMQEHDPAAMQAMEKLIADLSRQGQIDHTTLTLRQLMQKHNDRAVDRSNQDIYLLTNAVGAEQKLYHGADSAASWWRRNFRMYANIQVQAQPGERVLVVGGQGHTAILRDFVEIDSRLDEEPVTPYL